MSEGQKTKTPKASKDSIIKAVATATKISQGDAKKVLDSAVDTIRAELKAGRAVSLDGLVSMTPYTKPALVRNNFKGGTVDVPSRPGIRFKLSTNFSKELRGK